MRIRSLRLSPWLLGPVGLVASFLVIFHWRFPMIGPDFSELWAYGLAGNVHIRAQGLTPFYFSPHLCGGFPIYGSPNAYFYSPLQLLMYFFAPWTATLLTWNLFLLVGYLGWYRVGHDVLRVHRPWCHLLATMCLSSSFLALHVIIGHTNFLPFPLLGWILWAVFDTRTGSTQQLLMRTAIGALVATVMLHASGYFAVLFGGMLVLFLMPLDTLLWHGKRWLRLRTIALRCILLGVVSALCSLSKLTAIASLMRTFPRMVTMYPLAAETDSFRYLLRTFWAIPQGKNLFEGMPWELHENSISLSPMVFLGLGAGVALFIQSDRWAVKHARRVLAFLAWLIFTTLFFVQLLHWQGPLVDWLTPLPIFSSFRVATRFVYIFGILLCMLSTWCLAQAVGQRISTERILASAGIVVSLGALLLSTLPALKDARLSTNYEQYYTDYNAQHLAHRNLPVTVVTQGIPKVNASTSIDCYDPLFVTYAYDPASKPGDPQKRMLRLGAVDTVRDGYYNLINPACYQYGAENACAPGDAIRVDDAENLAKFRTSQPTTWHISLYQHIANWISFSSLLVTILFLVIQHPQLHRRFFATRKE